MEESIEASWCLGPRCAAGHHTGRTARRGLVTTVVLLVGLFVPDLFLPDSLRPAHGAPYQLRTENMDIVTDASRNAVRPVLRRMEHTLDRLMHYLHRPIHRRIQVYLIDDLSLWSPDMLPNRQAYEMLRRVGGGTERSAQSDGRGQVTLYARTLPGIPEHELVHAYCVQAFGWCGPEWLKEGMAELAYQGWEDSTHGCSAARRTHLQGSPPSLATVLATPDLASDSRSWILADRNRTQSDGAPDAPFDLATIEHLRSAYDGSWALCHFLFHHPRFQQGFRDYAGRTLRREACELRDALPHAAWQDVEFEFQQFMANLEDGYQVAPCAWPWNAEFIALAVDAEHRVSVNSAQGFQSSGTAVRAGESYLCRCRGQWRVEPGTDGVTADGDVHGRGRLTAVVYQNGEMSDPIRLGANSMFHIPCDGRLFLRCDEPLQHIRDNSGEIEVSLRRTQQ